MRAPEAGDLGYMTNALALASRGLGSTAPNPSVGCVIVNDGVVVGRGWTQPGGRPHAETVALDRAGALAKGATAYVTLEPCCHQGQTAPCTAALIGAGIARVVIAASDPDARVDGGGISALKNAGVNVSSGLLGAEAMSGDAGYFKRARLGVPFVALKSAASVDGRIALASGESQWITSDVARRYGHLLRSKYDAVLVGSGTVQADNPSLICRLPGYVENKLPQPVRVVLDRRLRIAADVDLVMSASKTPTWLVTGESASSEKVKKLQS